MKSRLPNKALHRCPSCLEAAVETEAGRVEVAAQAMERLEPGAEHVHLAEDLQAAAADPVSREVVPVADRDRPNTPKLRFVIRVRDGGRCSNPFCRRLVGADGQCHHIEFLSEGGRTTELNECLLCAQCHAAIHAGALVLEGDPVRGLEWKVACANLTRSVRENLQQIIQQASVRVVEIPAPSEIPDGASKSPSVEIPAALAATVRRALEVLGCSARQAKEALETAWKRLLETGSGRESISEESLIREACKRC